LRLQLIKYQGEKIGSLFVHRKHAHPRRIEKEIELAPIIGLALTAAEAGQQFPEDNRIQGNGRGMTKQLDGRLMVAFEGNIEIGVNE
jgi:hypothetical protein